MRFLSLALYLVTIFVSAFLLFQVQPMLARTLLPWFGGTPAVWTVCMLFFQVFLFLGYAYAHYLQKCFSLRWQGIVHSLLLITALLTLPLDPDPMWHWDDKGAPALHLLLLLATSVGVPYFLLSSTGPLLQVWFAAHHTGQSPYPLYAVSNAGSFIALLSYPFVFEVLFPISDQMLFWSYGFLLFTTLCTLAAISVLFRKRPAPTETSWHDKTSIISSGQRFLWIALPAVASLTLLAVTTYMTQDIAPVPLLWIAPLSLYLLSFILCFESDRWYRPKTYSTTLLLLLIALMVQAVFREHISPITSIIICCSFLFALCMVCHGELALTRPNKDKLTSFYLSIAAGGALGGVFVGLIAPSLYDTYVEFQLGFVCALILILYADRHDTESVIQKLLHKRASVYSVSVFGLVGLTMLLPQVDNQTRSIQTTRNFYGVLKLYDAPASDGAATRRLVHGRILHGLQYLEEDRQSIPTSYYGRVTGIGHLLEITAPSADSVWQERHIGVVGLGVATLAAYGTSQDTLRFYEINDDVMTIAQEQFSFLTNTRAATSIIPGDALLSLEKENPQGFDILVLDAFSGDAIPVHLLTQEAFSTYLNHMTPDGVIAVHISNRYLDLQPVLWAIADHFDLASTVIHSPADPANSVNEADWIFLTKNEPITRSLRKSASYEKRDTTRTTYLWTNEYSNIFRILKF